MQTRKSETRLIRSLFRTVGDFHLYVNAMLVF